MRAVKAADEEEEGGEERWGWQQEGWDLSSAGGRRECRELAWKTCLDVRGECLRARAYYGRDIAPAHGGMERQA